MQELFLTLAIGALLSQQPEGLRATETRVRFEQSLSIRTPEAAAQPVRVSLRDWVVRNRQKASLTAGGMLIMHVRGGAPVFTSVDGVRTERKDEEFFVVPPGATLLVETGNDTCVFTVLEVLR
jgi:hypothetical protein